MAPVALGTLISYLAEMNKDSQPTTINFSVHKHCKLKNLKLFSQLFFQVFKKLLNVHVNFKTLAIFVAQCEYMII